MAFLKVFSQMTTINNLCDVLRGMEFDVNSEIRGKSIQTLRIKTDIRFLGETEKVFITIMVMW